jgi:hypothetical protein
MMNRKKTFFGFFAVVVFVAAWILFLGSPAFCAENQIKFSLTLDKAEYTLQEPVNLTFTLKNLGKEPVMVSKRFYIGDPQAAVNQRDIYLTLVSSTGEKITGKYFYPTGYPKTDYFQLLGPNEEVKSEYTRNLYGYFELKEPGIYTVSAVYQNAFGAEIGLDTFKEPLASEPVKFTIVNNKK